MVASTFSDMLVVIQSLLYFCTSTLRQSPTQGAGRSSEVERSLMVRWVVGSILHGVDPLSQCPTTGASKAVICIILSVGWCI